MSREDDYIPVPPEHSFCGAMENLVGKFRFLDKKDSTTLLTANKARQSMSGRANPYDNAWTESFFGTLKNEMLQEGIFIDESDARTELLSYIDGYYNTH